MKVGRAKAAWKSSQIEKLAKNINQMTNQMVPKYSKRQKTTK